MKGYARLSPDFSMDFVRLIYFVVFLMLDKMQKKIFWKIDFFNLRGDDFQIDYLRQKFFSKTDFFFVFKSFRMSHLTMRRHFFVTAILLFIICLGGTKENHRKRNQTHLFCDVINDFSFMSLTSSVSR